MYITKVSGKKVKFNPNKIKRTCLRAGADRFLAQKIERLVSLQVKEGMSTKTILRLILDLLEELSPITSARYRLKEAMLGLGPNGFIFEKFIVFLLKAYGYKAYCPPILEGHCVNHEIDIIATKNFSITIGEKENYLIECKYHNSPGTKTELKDALCLWARFDDLKEKGFIRPWLISNTKFSKSAIQYAHCRNIRLLGWQNPSQESLNYLIENKKLYPVTILKHLDKTSTERLFSQNIILASQLLSYGVEKLEAKTGIAKSKLNELAKEAKFILEY